MRKRRSGATCSSGGKPCGAERLSAEKAQQEPLTAACDLVNLEQAESIANGIASFAKCRKTFRTALRMVRASIVGEYDGVSLSILVALIGAVLYVLNPADMVPDPIPILGYLDDLAVIATTLDSALSEIAVFEAWEVASGRKSDDTR